MPMLETVKNITLNNAIVRELDLSRLKSSENINFSGTVNLKELHFPVLKSAGNISFSNATSLQQLDFPVLETANNFSLSQTTELGELNIPVLKQAGNISLSSTQKLRELNLGAAEMNNFTVSSFDTISIKGSGKINNTLNISSQVNYFKIEGITEIGNISSTSVATYVECLGLGTVSGNVQIRYMDDGKLLLPDLQTVKGNFTFDCYATTEIVTGSIDLGKLETIGGRLTVSGTNNNAKLTHLNMFTSLKNAAAITIRNNARLVDYSGLKNVLNSLSAANWTATGNAYNPTYQDLLNGNWIKE